MPRKPKADVVRPRSDGIVRMHEVRQDPTHEEYDYYGQTYEHITKVQDYISEIVYNLGQRRSLHDRSKLSSPERQGFRAMMERTPLSEMEYDGPEYRAALAENQDTLRHHYAANDHHAEFFEA